MTPLAKTLAARIAAEGPLKLSDYMAECLMHPAHGYYATRDPLGERGDFTTAPEISQMFGEMVGLALGQAWLDQGAPERIALAELGPGRGTLMADILRALRAVPGARAAAALHLVETSPTLRARQQETLAGHGVTWHAAAADLPDDRPLFLVANEFFDALPIRQFQRAEGEAWQERRVGLRDGRLVPGLAGPAPQPELAHRLEDTAPGDVVEICPAAPAIAQEIGARIERHGGVALIVDYGGWRSRGDTLQAVAGHAAADPFEAPGEADLTAHVDFEAIARAAPCAHARLTPQGVFLERLGLTARARILARSLSGAGLESHVAAHRRLTHPEEMGTLFKCLALHPSRAAPPPGVDP
ncbi:class I SAM-dependent methyltransferase [Rhodosalinus halophilus]|uniref:Class I SAM-dependent methyltransferase n=1 Tax=Rhodosalinus halophilus TaxID=2259333 RepID=A0A365UCU5_9RHOB|nr:SAM-dependent methyltransferase [Rhodosalinus halophilus]RBI87146.1 class I SAM-dependent methyltransferase [Rhodosalinus halophilus]